MIARRALALSLLCLARLSAQTDAAFPAPADTGSPAGVWEPGLAPAGDSGAAGSYAEPAAPKQAVLPVKQATVETEALADLDASPTVIMLPMTLQAGRGDSADMALAESGLRLGLVQSGRFKVWSAEAADNAWPRGRAPRDCFSERCLNQAAANAPTTLVLATQFAARDSQWVVRMALAQAPGGKIRRAMQVWGRQGPEGLIAFAREAALRLADPAHTGPGVDGAFFASGGWRSIPWLNPRDSVDNRQRWGWTGTALMAAGLSLAYAQGVLSGADANDLSPARPMLSGEGADSFLRGFFAGPALGARFAAMGGAGTAAVANGMSLLMNPAGVAASDRENVVAAKRVLADGTPSAFVAYAGPAYHRWHQGLGVRFEGDRLANETTLHGALACDLEMFGRAWAGIKAGAQAKLYLAQVGEGGNGADRSTGRSYGMGLDFGLQAPLNDRITAALSVRDAAGFLRHRNTFTDESYGEILPIEWKLGAACRASDALTLLLDGQKAIWADQADHLRLGGEQVLWDFLALRGGLHEVFGREAVRMLAVGFGLDTDGLKDKALKVRLSLDYSYEFGLGADAPLAGGQQFTLEAGF